MVTHSKTLSKNKLEITSFCRNQVYEILTLICHLKCEIRYNSSAARKQHLRNPRLTAGHLFTGVKIWRSPTREFPVKPQISDACCDSNLAKVQTPSFFQLEELSTGSWQCDRILELGQHDAFSPNPNDHFIQLQKLFLCSENT